MGGIRRSAQASSTASVPLPARQEIHLKAVRRRLTLWYLCAILLAVTVLTIWFYQTTRLNLAAALDNTLKAHVDVVSREVWFVVQDPNDPNSPPAHIDTTDSYTTDDSAHFTDYRVYVTNASFHVINVGGHDLAADAPQPATFLRPDQHAIRQAIDAGESLDRVSHVNSPVDLYLAVIFDNSDTPQPFGWIIAEGSLSGVEAQSHALLWQLMLGSTLLLLFSVGGGWFLAGRAIQPIRLSLAQQQQFVDDAAHQIGTPLSIIQARAELALKADLQDGTTDVAESTRSILRRSLLEVIDETKRLHHLARELMTLARLDRGQFDLKRDLLALNEVLDEVFQQVQPLATMREVQVRLDPAVDLVTVRGDFDRLREVLLILAENALKYASSGGQVALSLLADEHQGQVVVRDTGPGIATEDAARIFERFYRSASARGSGVRGSGLGLAIALRLAQAHHGTITVASTPGKGTTMRLLLPRVKVSLDT